MFTMHSADAVYLIHCILSHCKKEPTLLSIQCMSTPEYIKTIREIQVESIHATYLIIKFYTTTRSLSSKQVLNLGVSHTVLAQAPSYISLANGRVAQMPCLEN